MPCFHVDPTNPTKPHDPSGEAGERQDYRDRVDKLAGQVQPKVVQWRHDIHEHAELSNREYRTAAKVADHLRSLDLNEVTTDVAPTGVVGILKGGRPGKVMALRADMDALPVKETAPVPFASTEVDEDYPGGPFPVAHSCGHDAHTAMLMGAAEVLVQIRDDLPGTVMFVFQPAEEGPPPGEPFGAGAMLEAGVFKEPRPSACFVLHTGPLPVGHLAYARGTMTSASALFKVDIQGKHAHGATPWTGLDPMPPLATISNGFGQIYRQVDANQPITISVGKIDTVGRTNIIGGEITAWGTVRCVRDDMMDDVSDRMSRVVDHAAQTHGLTATIEFYQRTPSTVNEPEWVERFAPSLERAAGTGNVHVVEPALVYDDASRFIREAGGLYVMLGSQNVEFTEQGLEPTDPDDPLGGLVFNHNPAYYVVDEAMETGVRAHCHVTMDFLSASSRDAGIFA